MNIMQSPNCGVGRNLCTNDPLKNESGSHILQFVDSNVCFHVGDPARETKTQLVFYVDGTEYRFSKRTGNELGKFVGRGRLFMKPNLGGWLNV